MKQHLVVTLTPEEAVETLKDYFADRNSANTVEVNLDFSFVPGEQLKSYHKIACIKMVREIIAKAQGRIQVTSANCFYIGLAEAKQMVEQYFRDNHIT